MAASTCAAYQVRFAQLRPKAFGPNAAAAGALAIGRGDFEAAAPFFKRAAESLEVEFEQGFQVAGIDLFPFHRAWVDNDPDTALKALEPAAGRLAAARGGQLWNYPWFLGSAYLTLGRLDQAREVLQWMRVSPQYGNYRNLWLALTAYVADRPDVVEEELGEYARNPSFEESVGLILFARTGHLDQAERLLAGMRAGLKACDGHLKAAQGELALAKGDLATAVPLLQDACGLLVETGTPEYFLAAESLANALQDLGRPSSAISVLVQASLQKRRAYILSGFLWLRIRFQLAQMYRLTGQPEKALPIETELRKLLKYADPDHPLVMALQRQ